MIHTCLQQITQLVTRSNPSSSLNYSYLDENTMAQISAENLGFGLGFGAAMQDKEEPFGPLKPI